MSKAKRSKGQAEPTVGDDGKVAILVRVPPEVAKRIASKAVEHRQRLGPMAAWLLEQSVGM